MKMNKKMQTIELDTMNRSESNNFQPSRSFKLYYSGCQPLENVKKIK